VTQKNYVDNATPQVPQHIAIIMDGNGRWAQQRHLPRTVGHAKGASIVRDLVNACLDKGIQHLTLFAFSTENWKRPEDEVSTLMGLFIQYLEKEMKDMKKEGVRLNVIGDISRFPQTLQDKIHATVAETAQSSGIVLNVAANYGGQWDIVQAVKAWQQAHPGESVNHLSPEALSAYLCGADQPPPDLLIRTGGESRISNFMLWQLAYAELYFTDVLWPDFDLSQFSQALDWFAGRQRRFGAVTH
jgi:undecaprenyl diphosphate synthase